MILDENIKIKWYSNIKAYYINKGYIYTKIGDEFQVKTFDLPQNSTIKIHVKCDICGNEKQLAYGIYNINTKNNITYYSCSNKCSMKKNNETNLQKYGIEYPQKLKLTKEKAKQTNLKKYGVESVTQNEIVKKKIKQTNILRYGTENIQNLDFVIEKKKCTNLKNCGTEYNFSSQGTKEKTKKTNLKKYGVEYVTQSEKHKEKRAKTNLEKYGFKYPLQNKKIKEKLIETTINKYGEIWFKNIPSYNPNSIIYLDIIAKKLNIPIQHALNGGEKKFIKYWVDGYIEKHNICIEWDETPHMYSKEKDLIRENYLKKNFNCKIIRINEKEFLKDIENQINIVLNKINNIIFYE